MACSNSAWGMDDRLLCGLLCRWQLLLRDDPAFRGVLPGVSACDLENSQRGCLGPNLAVNATEEIDYLVLGQVFEITSFNYQT
jgi:hypothetical protein